MRINLQIWFLIIVSAIIWTLNGKWKCKFILNIKASRPFPTIYTEPILDKVFFLHFCFKDLKHLQNLNSKSGIHLWMSIIISLCFRTLVGVCLSLKTLSQFTCFSCLNFGYKQNVKVMINNIDMNIFQW